MPLKVAAGTFSPASAMFALCVVLSVPGPLAKPAPAVLPKVSVPVSRNVAPLAMASVPPWSMPKLTVLPTVLVALFEVTVAVMSALFVSCS